MHLFKRQYSKVTGDTLVIRDAAQTDQGTYLCLAKNDAGSAQAAAYLYIQSELFYLFAQMKFIKFSNRKSVY